MDDRLNALRRALDAAGVPYAILWHAATYRSAEEAASQLGLDLAVLAPTFVLRSEGGPLIATISGATRLSYRKIKRALGLKDVSLASAGEVETLTGAAPGTVALVNPGLATLVDARLMRHAHIYGGCGAPACTLKMRPADVVAVAGARVLDIAEDKADRA